MNDFLGRGWSFPPTFRKGGDGVDMVVGREDIEQSLTILLSTTLGERVLQPSYGANLNRFQFDPLNGAFIARLRDTVETAILYHEARIRTDSVTVTPDNGPDAINGRVLIEVTYRIRATNSRFNFIFPFYRNEGVAL